MMTNVAEGAPDCLSGLKTSMMDWVHGSKLFILKLPKCRRRAHTLSLFRSELESLLEKAPSM